MLAYQLLRVLNFDKHRSQYVIWTVSNIVYAYFISDDALGGRMEAMVRLMLAIQASVASLTRDCAGMANDMYSEELPTRLAQPTWLCQ